MTHPGPFWRRSLDSRMLLLCFAVLTGNCALSSTVTEAADSKSAELLKQIGLNRGLCVILGEDEQVGRLAIDLARNSELTLYLQMSRTEDATSIRKQFDAAGLLGTRIYVTEGTIESIKLGDRLADAVILTEPTDGPDGVSGAELLRVVHPGGKIITGKSVEVVSEPVGTGQWSHPYHGPDNNPQGDDLIARAPYLTQFLAAPYYGPMPQVTVAAGGRVFKVFGHIAFKRREWPLVGKLICLNGYNGVPLWERELTPGFMIHRNTLIATPETLYLADNESCKLIDAATGEIRDEIVIPPNAAEGPGWKWMALKDGVLFALVGERDLRAEVLRGTRTRDGWPWSGLGKEYARKDYPWGFGKTLLAINSETKQILWTHREHDVIDSRALCMNSQRIFIYSDQKFLAALDAKTGEMVWRTTSGDVLQPIGPHKHAQNPREGYASSVYAKCNERAIYFAGPQRSRLVAVSTDDGRLLWDYPEGNFQLVLRDDALYAMGRTVTSKKFEFLTGEILGELACFRGNCTRATGTADSIFTRGYRHTGTMRFDVASATPNRVALMRPGCQDGVVAAHGLLYWGPWMCDCNHSLVGVICLGPAGDFDFEQRATDAERLQTDTGHSKRVTEFAIDERDWPTYRSNNSRTATTPVAVPGRIRLQWQFQGQDHVEPAAPVAAGGLTFLSGSDGVVRAVASATGELRWTAYTGGPIRYPPAVWNSRMFVGSGDGWVYAFEVATGRRLWRFRAAPVQQRIPVYGKLMSRWPVNSGVLAAAGVIYAAAGIASYDGTHVYALDAVTGNLRWQNHTSGRLIGGRSVTGVSVQGHLLLEGDTLYMAGGNVVSPAKYDTRTGGCLNVLTTEFGGAKSPRAPRGSELFLADGKVRVVDRLLYAPRGKYIPSGYHAKYLVEASSGDMLIQGTERAMMRVALNAGPDGKHQLIWQNRQFVETSAVVLTSNAVLVVGRLRGRTKQAQPESVLLALQPADGQVLWREPLPAPAAAWGLAVDRDGRILVALVDGRILCYGKSP